MPQVRVKNDKSLSIDSKIGEQIGFEAGRVLNIVKDGDKIVLEPIQDPLRTEILADVAKSKQAIQEGRCSQPITTMEELDAYLESE